MLQIEKIFNSFIDKGYKNTSDSFIIMRFTVRRIFDNAEGTHAPSAFACVIRCAFRETHFSPIVEKTGASRFWGYAPLGNPKHRRALTVKARAGRETGGAACLGLDWQRTTV